MNASHKFDEEGLKELAASIEAVGVLRDKGIPIKMGGETRFGEAISGGIIGPVVDSSIDELISSQAIVCDCLFIRGFGLRELAPVEKNACTMFVGV